MKRIIVSFLATVSILAGCKSNENDDPEDPGRTVIAYLVADNNLYNNALADINEMESAWDDSYNGNLVVFLNGKGGTNVLYHIRKGSDPEKIESDIVKVYSTGSRVCSGEFLNQVITDAMKLYPARSYALDMWSHGRAWFPRYIKSPLFMPDNGSKFFYGNEKPVTSDFGQDDTNDETLEVYDMAEVLSAFHFDFIMADACHMGSVECAYQLKDVCDYYISSAAETKTDGFPYEQIMPDMFATPANTEAIARKFFEYYDAQSGSSRTATISVVESDKLERVASELQGVVTSSPYIPLQDIQQYGRFIARMDDCLYDLEDFVIKTWGTGSSTAFCNALSDAVIYKAATPEILSEIEVKHFCGLSCYIPRATQPVTNEEYEIYDWADDSGLLKIVE